MTSAISADSAARPSRGTHSWTTPTGRLTEPAQQLMKPPYTDWSVGSRRYGVPLQALQHPGGFPGLVRIAAGSLPEGSRLLRAAAPRRSARPRAGARSRERPHDAIAE